MEQYTLKKNFARRDLFTWLEHGSRPELAHLHRVKSRYYNCMRTLHAHADTVELVLVSQGSSVFSINGVPYGVDPGDLLIYNSNVVHEENFEHDKNLECYSCSIRGLHLKGLRENALIPDSMPPIFHTTTCDGVNRFHSISSLFELMFFHLGNPMSRSEDACAFLLFTLIATVLDITQSATTPDQLQKAKDTRLCMEIKAYIDEHFCEDLTLQAIAQEVNISMYHMSHIFKRQYGYSPLQYITYRRIGEAQTLLEKTDESATQIGIKVGFGNPSYFNTIFTKKVGMSPLKYRKIYAFTKDDDDPAASPRGGGGGVRPFERPAPPFPLLQRCVNARTACRCTPAWKSACPSATIAS